MIIIQNSISVNEILKKYIEFGDHFGFYSKVQIENELEFFEITYLVGKLKINGFLIKPKLVSNKLPVIVYNRGGSKDYSNIKSLTLLRNISALALSGFIVIASQYNGNGGSEGKDECGGSDLDSILVFKEIIGQLSYADSTNINMFGISRGGMMAYLANTKVEWIKKTIIISGEVDLIDEYKRRPRMKNFRSDMYDVDSDNENKKRSIIYNIDKLKPSSNFMIFHGSEDLHIHPKRVIDFTNLMYKNNKKFSFHFFDGQDHYLKKSKKLIIEMSVKWFKS